MEDERRLTPRIDFDLDVIIKGQKGLKKITNFSTGGVFIETEDPSRFKLDDRVELITRLPLESKMMPITAQVAHVASAGIGVQFKDLWGYKSEAIDNHFGVFKATMPLAAA